MNDATPPPRDDGPKFPTVPVLIAAAIVVLGGAWYFWVKSDWNNAGTWGAIGDAVGPFTGLATALALGFAVYATMLQRKELELQRDEMRAQREEMRRQREEAEKSVKAQTELVEAQRQLAKAQGETALATLGANYSAAMVALVQLRVRVAEVSKTQGTAGTAFELGCGPHLESLDDLAKDAYAEYVRASVRLNE